jgi:hypothetical protein
LPALRHILVADTPFPRPEADVVVWLGRGEAPPALADGKLLIEPSSARAAAIYVAAAPAELHLALAEPLEFLSLLVEVRGAPALRAA